MKHKVFKIKELTFDKSFYPRAGVNLVTVLSYASAMKTGSKFPPILVGMYKGKKYVLDGWHRSRAVKQNKEKYIEGEYQKFKNEREMYIEAVRRNTTHGLQYSPYEKRRMILRLEELDVDVATIEDLVKIPLDKITKFVANGSMVNAITGKRVAVKSTLKPFAGGLASEELLNAQKIMANTGQEHLLDQIIALFRNDAVDFNNREVTKKLSQLYHILESYAKPSF